MRNIKGIRASQDLFDDLSPDPADWAIAITAEGEGSTPTRAALVTRPFDYGSVITYTFDPSHWNATRYSDGRRFGVWYGSLDLKTTVCETVYHWHRFVMDCFPDENRVITGERRVCDVRCDALLVDLRDRVDEAPELLSRTSYVFSQNLGAYLHAQGHHGILAPSARCEGTNAAVFRPDGLSHVRDRCFLTYRCNPTLDAVTVERQRGRTWLTLSPSTLY